MSMDVAKPWVCAGGCGRMGTERTRDEWGVSYPLPATWRLTPSGAYCDRKRCQRRARRAQEAA